MPFRQAARAAAPNIPKLTKWGVSKLSAPKTLIPSVHSEPEFIVLKRPNSKPMVESTPHQFVKHRETMKKDFPDGWSPSKKLPREAMNDLRSLHAHAPETFTTPVLAERFRISPEAVRRILKSKWVPPKERMKELLAKDEQRRVDKVKRRAEKEWTESVETGVVGVRKTDDDRLELG